MKRFIITLVIGVFSLLAAIGFHGTSQTVEASSVPLPSDWPAISQTCNDVTGDGKVDLANDILGVILHANTQWGDDNYALLYDTAGGGQVDLPNDILGTILSFDPTGVHGPVEYGGDGTNCPLLDTQIIRAAAAVMRYQDCQAAAADGYESTGVYVPDMGIHITKLANLRNTFDPDAGWDGIDPLTATDLANPFGLVCSIDPSWNGSGAPPVGKLIGPWYIVPNDSTGTLYQNLGAPVSSPYLPDEFPPAATPPVGFSGTADYYEYDASHGGVQAAWHTHWNLCVQPGSLSELGPNPPQGACNNGLIIYDYGWMLHMYNFVPNTNQASVESGGGDPRFSRWNRNPSFPICGYAAAGCSGGAGAAGEVEFDGGAFVCPILSAAQIAQLEKTKA